MFTAVVNKDYANQPTVLEVRQHPESVKGEREIERFTLNGHQAEHVRCPLSVPCPRWQLTKIRAGGDVVKFRLQLGSIPGLNLTDRMVVRRNDG
jgi:hypothetical protein